MIPFCLLILTTGCAVLHGPGRPSALPTFESEALAGLPPFAERVKGSAVRFVESDEGIRIPVRVLGEEGGGTPVVMMHGLQSHSGWFVQSAGLLASLGCPVYAMDRRGSGLSEEPRGDCDDFTEMIRDIDAVAEYAMNRHGTDKVHILGHCFGSIPATAYACSEPDKLASLILPTPGLNTKTDLGLGTKLRIFFAHLFRRETQVAIPLAPEMFSELEYYVTYIRQDDLSLSEATGSFFLEVRRARGFIRKHADELSMPLFMACAEKDPICDNAKNRTFFERLPRDEKLFTEYKEARHVLEFSTRKDAFFRDLAAWIRKMEDR